MPTIPNLPDADGVTTTTKVVVVTDDGVTRQAEMSDIVAIASGLEGDLGDMALQNKGSVDITGGTIAVGKASATTLNVGTVAISGGTGTLDLLNAGTVTVSGTATVATIKGTSATLSGTASAATVIGTTGTIGTLTVNHGTVTLEAGTIANFMGTTVAASGTLSGVVAAFGTSKEFRARSDGTSDKTVSYGDGAGFRTSRQNKDGSWSFPGVELKRAAPYITSVDNAAMLFKADRVNKRLLFADETVRVYATPDPEFIVRDTNGYVAAKASASGVGFGWFAQGAGGGGGGGDVTPATTFSDLEITTEDAWGLGYSERVKGEVTNAPWPIWGLSHVIIYGQSLSIGIESRPPLSTTPISGNYMIGNVVRGNNPTSAWASVGTAQLNPLIAVCNQGNTILDAAAIAALGESDTTPGETPGEGALNFFRYLWLRDRGLTSDQAHRLLLTAPGRGGQTIAALSKGDVSAVYDRLAGCATVAKGLADAVPLTYGVLAMIWIQGEADYAPVETSIADYKAAMLQLRDDFYADTAIAVAGQTEVPAMFTYQTGGSWAKDALKVGMAQLELTQENKNWFLFAPAYPVTNRPDGHLNANGSRWLGMQCGKVMYRVFIRRENWLPLHPVKILWRVREILIVFHTPVAPLQFGQPYDASEPQDFSPDYGFRVEDDAGGIGVTATLAGQTVVKLALDRTPNRAPDVVYADLTHFNGNGSLHDSDEMDALYEYEWTADTGALAEEDRPELEGNLLSLVNWCVAFRMTAVAA